MMSFIQFVAQLFEEKQKNTLTKIKSELIQQDVDSNLVDPMNMTEVAKALDDSNKTIANYLQEEE